MPAPLPSNSMIGLSVKPGWVVPSMITGSVITGNADRSWIVCCPPPAMLNVIVSSPELALASRMTWRKEPVPESWVLVTTGRKVVKSHVVLSLIPG